MAPSDPMKKLEYIIISVGNCYIIFGMNYSRILPNRAFLPKCISPFHFCGVTKLCISNAYCV